LIPRISPSAAELFLGLVDQQSTAPPGRFQGRKTLNKPARTHSDSLEESASRDQIFSNKLTIVIRPEDAENFKINLFEVRDHLTRSLHA